MNNENHDADSRALNQYGILMQYLAYENTMYWGRSGFFLLASTALLGFVATNLLPLCGASPLEKVLVQLVTTAAGGILSLLWYRALNIGEDWIDHWQGLLRAIEPAAFAEHHVHRDPPPARGSRDRRLARHTVHLFSVVWAVLVVYSLALMGIRFVKWIMASCG